jgi:monovalent cation:H+ antiporter-2, CPA2 family
MGWQLTIAPLATTNFLGDLALVLCVAAVTTVIFQALRQPVVVGYLVAGMAVGPHLKVPLLANYDRIHTLSELGVILLMFALGLEFSVRKLIKLGPTSGFITAIQVGLMIWLGYLCGKVMGWTPLESIFTGAFLSISSTTIVAKAYEETTVTQRLRDLVFGVLLMEDLTAVVELAILTTLASGTQVSAPMLFSTLARLVIFLVLLVGIGIIVVPRVIRLVVRLNRPETTLIASVGIAFGMALLAEHAGYSVALGAFLGGSLVAESGEVHSIEHLVAPVRDLFGAVFFVSVGMMIDPGLIAEHWLALIFLVGAVIIGKVVAVGLGSLMSGAGIKTSVEAGMSLAQIGEFSFIIAGVGLHLNATREFIYTLAVAVSAITTFTTPFMIRAAEPFGDFVAGHFPEPVALLQSLYDSWMERVKIASTAREERVSLRWPIVVITGSAIAIGAILIFNEIDPLDFTTKAAHLLEMTYFDAGLVVDVVALIVCAPFALSLYYGSRRLATAIAMRAIPITTRKTLERKWATAERALIEMLQLTILLGVVMPLVAIVQPFMEEVEGVGIVVIAGVLMGIVVWRSARLMQGQMRAAVELLTASFTAREETEVHPALHEHELPGIGSLTAIRIMPNCDVAGRTFKELELRSSTGATVVAIARGEEGFHAPEPNEIIRGGDVLELAGSSDAIAAAAAFLNAKSDGAPPAADIAPAVASPAARS